MVGRAFESDAQLLSDALALDQERLTLLRREPLGRGSVAGFTVRDDTARGDYFVDTSGLDVEVETGMLLPGRARIWMHPADPYLPALAPAAYGGAVAVLLARIGREVARPAEIVAYRPGRRAVLRVATRDGDVWLKVVRPTRVEAIVDAHALLAAAGLPVPLVRAWSRQGLIALDAAAGLPATAVAWHPEALLDIADDVRERFARVPFRSAARTGLTQRLPWYTARLAAVARRPELVHAVSKRAAHGARTSSDARGAIHGDLHLGQLFLHGTGTTVTLAGIIDVDTAGRGDAIEDAAAFLSHAVASAILTENGGDVARAWALAEGAQRRWGDRPAVREHAAIHLLGHALAAVEEGHDERGDRLLGCADELFSAAGSSPKTVLMHGFEQA